MEVRFVRPKPGEERAVFELMKNLDSETDFMLYEKDERRYDERAVSALIGDKLSLFLCAEIGGEYVGYLAAKRGGLKRIRHSAYVVAGIRQKARRQGIGKKLFALLEKWAAENDLARLELTVIKDNETALHLYKKRGFEIEGVKRHSIFSNGEYRDEYYMAKLAPFMGDS